MPGQPATAKKGVRGPQKPTKTPTADDTARPNTAPRTVRPRQLHVNDKASADTLAVLDYSALCKRIVAAVA